MVSTSGVLFSVVSGLKKVTELPGDGCRKCAGINDGDGCDSFVMPSATDEDVLNVG